MSTNQQVGTVEKQRRTNNFRNAMDVETFYRFVSDNGLRREAKMVLDKIVSLMGQSTKKKRKRRGRSSRTLH